MARGIPNPATPKVPCKECGKTMAETWLYSHMRSVHGIYGGRSGIPKRRPGMPPTPKRVAAMGRDETITVPIIPNPITKSPQRFRVLDSMKVLTAEDGSLWIGEKIRD